MLEIEIDIPNALLKVRFRGRVTPEETARQIDDVREALSKLNAGFRILADLSRVESMDPRCAADIGKTMELCDQRGVSKIVRIIPDPTKDIGLNILSLFHYHRRIPTVTCRNLAEALQALSE